MSRPVLMFCCAMVVVTAVPAAGQDLSAVIREVLEPGLRERAGIGYASFECAAEPPLGPGDRFTCVGVDEIGDELRYTLLVDGDGGASVERAEQRAASLLPEDLELLEEPCRSFLDAYGREDWQALFSELHPELQDTIGSPDGVKAFLEPVRSFYGQVNRAEPTWFAALLSGANELDYRLRCAGGEAWARFQIAADTQGQPRLFAFVVTAIPGSPEQALLLEQAARDQLSPVIGVDIEGVDAPFEELIRPGDVVEGIARLGDGRKIVVRVEQHGVRDDYDIDDFRFAVLDIPFLIDRALRTTLEGYGGVSCAARVIPDGGETRCAALIEDGSRKEFIVRRRGGDHRLIPVAGDTP